MAATASSAACAFDPSGPPAWAMSGLPPPPLPPSASAHQLDSVVARGEVRRDPDDDPGLALPGHADDGDDAGADLLLALVDEALEVLEVDAIDGTREQLHLADRANAVVRPAA